MGFLPFVNHDGLRVIRWPRLIVAWACIMLAAFIGSSAASYFLTGNARLLDWVGIWMGTFGCAVFLLSGYTTPINKLPSG
jgi:hypothetical protein